MPILLFCRQLPYLLEMAPFNVLTKEMSSTTLTRPLVGHLGDTRECLKSALEASMVACVTSDGMKQLPRPYAVITSVPAMVCYLLACYVVHMMIAMLSYMHI